MLDAWEYKGIGRGVQCAMSAATSTSMNIGEAWIAGQEAFLQAMSDADALPFYSGIMNGMRLNDDDPVRFRSGIDQFFQELYNGHTPGCAIHALLDAVSDDGGSWVWRLQRFMQVCADAGDIEAQHLVSHVALTYEMRHSLIQYLEFRSQGISTLQALDTVAGCDEYCTFAAYGNMPHTLTPNFFYGFLL